MSQLTDNLNLIASIKSDIKSAIEAKGVSMTGVSFGSFADKIGEITTSFVTVPLSVSANGTYNPGQGVDGFSEVIVNVPQTGFTEKDITEKNYGIVNLSNSASYVGSYAFMKASLQTVSLPNCEKVYRDGFQSCYSLTTVYLPSCSALSAEVFYSCSNLISVDIQGCKIIESYAFAGCIELSSINMSSCESIGFGVFSNCRALSSITLPVCILLSDNAFNYCTGLTYVDLPVCRMLKAYAFSACGNNLSMVILRSTSMCSLNGTTIFYGTDNAYVYVPSSLLESYKTYGNWSSMSNRLRPILDDYMFSNGLVYGWASSIGPDYLEELSISADDVTSVSFNMLQSMSSSTFMNHYNLASFDLNIGEYPDDTFNGCSSLSEVDLFVSVLGDRVFANCAGLETVNIKKDVNIIDIGSDVFLNCPNLTQINIPMTIYNDYLTAPGWSEYSSLMYSILPELAFSDGLVYGSASSITSDFMAFLGITSNQVLEVSLPNCLSVGYRTFYHCDRLTKAYIPECTYLSNGAFGECSYLSDVNLDKCEYIGNQVFQGDFRTNMNGSGLNLPVCSYIGSSAFYWCLSLRSITLGYSSVVTGYRNTFSNLYTGSVSFYVPSSLVEDYKTSPILNYWSNNIYPIPE